MEIHEIDASSVAERTRFGRKVKPRKSRITNGKDLLPNIDGRSALARRYRDIAGAILIDQGGVERCSESRIQLIRRFAAAAVLAEQLEGRLANGEQIDIAQHATLSSTLVRLAQRIGIDRIPHDVTPSLAEYLNRHAPTNAADETDGPEATVAEAPTGDALKPAEGSPISDAEGDEAGT
jgi:hypothetical protein